MIHTILAYSYKSNMIEIMKNFCSKMFVISNKKFYNLIKYLNIYIFGLYSSYVNNYSDKNYKTILCS